VLIQEHLLYLELSSTGLYVTCREAEYRLRLERDLGKMCSILYLYYAENDDSHD
jgi:hypothetical protein